MRPATAAITIDRPLADIYDLLEDITAHERFLDHFLVDWQQISDHPRGVGAAVRFRAKSAGAHDVVEAQVIEADGRRIVEQSRGGEGFRRLARGTYELAEVEGGTRVSFRLELIEGNRVDRAAWPLGRLMMARGTQRGLERLKAQMENGRH